MSSKIRMQGLVLISEGRCWGRCPWFGPIGTVTLQHVTNKGCFLLAHPYTLNYLKAVDSDQKKQRAGKRVINNKHKVLMITVKRNYLEMIYILVCDPPLGHSKILLTWYIPGRSTQLYKKSIWVTEHVWTAHL